MNKKIIVLVIVLVVILGLGISGYFAVKKAIQLGKEKGGEILNDLSSKEGGQPAGESGQPAEESEGSYDKPTADAPGKDLPGVPRYPGAVRGMYGTIPGFPDSGFYIMYDAPGSAKEVKDFYEAQLPANGWKSSISDEEAEKNRENYQSIGAEFYRFSGGDTLTRGKQQMVIQIGLSGGDYPGYTDVTITLPSDPFKSPGSFK